MEIAIYIVGFLVWVLYLFPRFVWPLEQKKWYHTDVSDLTFLSVLTGIMWPFWLPYLLVHRFHRRFYGKKDEK